MYGTSLFYNLYASNSQTEAYSGGAQWHVVVPPFFARKKYEIGTEINTHLRDIIFAKFSCQIP